ncbi:MAG: flagellar biosynthesis anti-sigma factor FlgM [Woeseiaceae bacterium]
MTNRIGPVDPNALGKVGSKVEDAGANRKVSGNSPASQAATNAPASANDTVELTSSAKLLERLDKTLSALPVIDNQRVDEVKSAIENGNYEIDADAIADAMIRFEQSLGD